MKRILKVMSRALMCTIVVMIGAAVFFLLVGIVLEALLWIGLGKVLSVFITLTIAVFIFISVNLYFDKRL